MVTLNKINFSGEKLMTCKLCLDDVKDEETFHISECHCVFCTACMKEYIKIAIKEGNVWLILCPDSACRVNGKLTATEIENLTTSDLYERYQRLYFEREVDYDPRRTFCPAVGCEAVCHILEAAAPVQSKNEECAPWKSATETLPSESVGVGSTSSGRRSKKKGRSITLSRSVTADNEQLGALPVAVICSQCQLVFCSVCKQRWHGTEITCDEADPWLSQLGIPYNNHEMDSPIKRCPACRIPIERNDGCAQMMCKRCKHVFCWYCLASLDDDFFLRHYDRGPCKNLLGHSRASVMLHRAQVVGIFLGFSVLMLIAAPFLLVAAPCILCCKCKKHCPLSCFSSDGTSQSGLPSTVDPELSSDLGTTSAMSFGGNGGKSSRWSRKKDRKLAHRASIGSTGSRSGHRSDVSWRVGQHGPPPSPVMLDTTVVGTTSAAVVSASVEDPV